MKLSHSKLQTILTNPLDYYLSYKQGITTKEIKPYFLTGSAVHWGLEHNTEDLSEFFNHNPNDIIQYQAESMVHGFYYHKKEIMNEIFDEVKPIEEYHELEINANLDSFIHPSEPHNFIGIIDLLYLTSKGFILMDYKTSSTIPDFNKYLDQLYRYIFELNINFPEIPIYKIGIINIVKSKIKKFNNESIEEYKRRYKEQYEKDYSHLINVNMFDTNNINKEEMDNYIKNLSMKADLAESIDKNELYYYDEEGAKNPYPSIFLPIYNKEDHSWLNYKIKDTYYNEITEEIQNERDCIELDTQVIDPSKRNKILNKYELFKKETDLIFGQFGIDTKEELIKTLEENFLCDNDLLENYWYIYSNKLVK